MIARNAVLPEPALPQHSHDRSRLTPWLCCLLLALLYLATSAAAASPQTLEELTAERKRITSEMEQYQRTLDVLQNSRTKLDDRSDTIVRLNDAIIRMKQELIAVTTAEVKLLEQQMAEEQAAASAPAEAPEGEAAPRDADRAEVGRLLALIARYYQDLADVSADQPPQAEQDLRQQASRQAARLHGANPQVPDRVLLSGLEGSAALARVSRRLADESLPESRRALSPICSVRTRMFGTLIASENSSLLPVGKRHYVGQVRLQPGDSTILVNQSSWNAKLDETGSAEDYLLLLYTPLGSGAELHLIDLQELRQLGPEHLPAWLPAELELGSEP